MSSRLRGYHLVAADGEIGHVDDFLLDEDGWTVRYLDVDTSNWIGGRSVLVAPGAITKIDNANRLIRVDLSREQIKNSPSIDSANLASIEPLPTVWILE